MDMWLISSQVPKQGKVQRLRISIRRAQESSKRGARDLKSPIGLVAYSQSGDDIVWPHET